MSVFERQYQTIVIGAGVAGCHAAISSASAGAETLILTSSWDNASFLAWGSCFSERRLKGIKCPGGLTRKALRRAALFKRTAGQETVWLVDSQVYQGIWKHQLERTERLEIFQDTCVKAARLADGWRVDTGWGVTYKTRTMVVATGVFLGASVEVGENSFPGGRPGETSDEGLLDSLREAGFPLEPAVRRAQPVISGPIDWEKLVLLEKGEPRSTGKQGAVPEIGLYAFRLRDDLVYAEPLDKRGNQHYLRGATSIVTEQELRDVPGLEKTRVIKPGHEVRFFRLSSLGAGSGFADQGIYFAGQIAGAGCYEESAQQGLRAGAMAAATASSGNKAASKGQDDA